MKLRYGIIGCGGIANGKHFIALKEIANLVDVVATCDIVLERAEDAAEQFNLTKKDVYTDYKKLLKRDDIDAVLVLTPNVSHSTISVAAMKAGKHVMCEKPMAINSVEAKKMLDASKKYEKTLTIAYQNRFRGDSMYLNKMVQEGDLGDVYYAKAHAIRRKGVPTWGVFTDEEKQGGGPLIDIGTHALDLTLWSMNNYEPHSVMGSTFKKMVDSPEGNAFGEWDKEDFTVEDSSFGFIKMKNGATIYLESSWALNIRDEKEAKCTLCGTLAGADMDNGLTVVDAKHGKLRNIDVNTDAGEVPFFEGQSTTPEVLEAYVFANAISNGNELVVKPEQAFVVTQILEAIYKSSKSGEVVYFD